MKRSLLPRRLWLLQITVLTACANEVDSVLPSLSTPSPITPSVICSEQTPIEVAVDGSGFSPVAIDLTHSAKAALPSLSLVRTTDLVGGAQPELTVVFSGDPRDSRNLDHLAWESQTRLRASFDEAITLADGTTGPLPEGVYDVVVTDLSGALARGVNVIASVPPPEVSDASPGIVCVKEGAREIEFTGVRLLTLGAEKPAFEIGGRTFSPTLEGCAPIPVQGVEATACTSAKLSLPPDLAAALYDVTVTNPAPAACHNETASRARVVDPPTITAIEPVAACVAEGPRQLIVTGTGFLSIDGARPDVMIGTTGVTVDELVGCESLETPGLTVETCTSLQITLPATAPAGVFDLVVSNPSPAGCHATAASSVFVAPPPTVTSVTPTLACVDDGDRMFSIDGLDFFTFEGSAPTVAFDMSVAQVTPTGCTTVELVGAEVQRCTGLEAIVAAGSVDAGIRSVRVTNPDPIGCTGSIKDAVSFVSGPEIFEVAPAVACTQGRGQTLTLSGTFRRIDGQNPEVQVDGLSVLVTNTGSCTSTNAVGHTLETCSSLELAVPEDTLTQGVIRVTDPDPSGCAATSSTALTVPPQIAISQVSPANVCSTLPGPIGLTLTGEGFVRVSGVAPTVRVGSQTATPSVFDGCSSIAADIESCTSMTVSLPAGFAPIGPVDVHVAIASPLGCSEDFAGAIRVVPPPTITSVDPPRFCSDVGQTLAIHGSSFAPGLRVTAGGVEATSVTFIDASRVDAVFASGLPAGIHEVTVENGPGCASTIPGAITVDPTPLVFFVDPPVLYSGVSIEATLFVSGLSEVAESVELFDSAGASIPIDEFSSPIRPNRIQATVPAGLTSGTYGVRVISQLGCVGELPGAVRVTDTLTLSLATISPSFSPTLRATAVTLTATVPPPAGLIGFVETPRAYLNPNPSAAGSVATALRSVAYQEEGLATAVIPSGLPVGSYDLIVVNPTGEVGVLESRVTITSANPPVVTQVVPGSLDNDQSQVAVVLGHDFEPAGVTVEMLCREPGSTAVVAAPATVSLVASDSITATFPSTSFLAGTVCIVKVTNVSDGAFFEYSAISIKNPAQNLQPWTQGPGMVVPRRALALEAGRPTDTSRFVYAIGGDAGAAASALDSVEHASVNVFGDMSSWALLPNGLPSPRTLSGSARIGRFLYLVGGFDGSAATGEVLQAEILDPLAAPAIDDLDAVLGDGSLGLSGGIYYYRVSATFPPSDLANPGGESLAGEPLVVQLPDNPRGIVLSLRWAPVLGANGYRVYRTSVNAPLSSAELVATVVTPTWVDEGTAVPDPSAHPLPPGALGRWHPVAPLVTARDSLAVVAVRNPGIVEGEEWYLYAIGGKSTTGGALDTYEFARVSVGARAQGVSTWTTGSSRLSLPRSELGAWVIDERDTSLVPAGDAWVYAGGGRGASALTGIVEAAKVQATGELSAWTETDSMSPRRAGYGYGDANGFLFAFGGQNGGASPGGVHSELSVVPDLTNWNSLAMQLNESRVFMCVAEESAFFFVAGGFDGTRVTNGVETTVQ
ncbi:MAG: IPT/TIG domain-containing protein [Deltaproteobacteria bacterium]|nr:IPT/TIG domain-containing protein [Deltaproteobacteria bacterium]